MVSLEVGGWFDNCLKGLDIGGCWMHEMVFGYLVIYILLLWRLNFGKCPYLKGDFFKSFTKVKLSLPHTPSHPPHTIQIKKMVYCLTIVAFWYDKRKKWGLILKFSYDLETHPQVEGEHKLSNSAKQ